MCALRVPAITVGAIGLLLTSTISALGAGAVSQAPLPSAGCGTSEMNSGRHVGAMQVSDLQRSWVLDVPSTHDGKTPLPLVVRLHGGGMDPHVFIAMTGFGGLI